jgi:anaerobic selenocysteine-containing dehydrogenase
VKDDRILKIEPASFPDPDYERICIKGIAMAMEKIHHPDRLTHPLIRAGKRGEGKWRQASWDEAYEYLAAKLTAVGEQHGWSANAWLSMTGNYGVKAYTVCKRIASTLQGSVLTNMGLMSDYAGMMGQGPMLGIPYSSNDVRDLANSRYLLMAGRNMADTAHSEMHFLFDALEAGTKLVVVDPRFSRTAAKADKWLAVRPGTDVALVMGMLHVIIKEGLMKQDYVLAYSNAAFLVRRDNGAMLREHDLRVGGSDAYMVWDEALDAAVPVTMATSPVLRGNREPAGGDGQPIACRTAFDILWETLKGFTPEHAASICEVSAADIRHTAIEYATTDPAAIYMSAGQQRYHYGHITWRAWVTLGALCGNIGKPFAGVNSIEGSHLLFVKELSPSWYSPTGTPANSLAGVRMLESIASGDVRSLWITNYSFATQTPYFRRFLEEALPKLELFAISEQMMTPAAAYADIVLPVVSYYEDDMDLVASVENYYMQLRRRAIPPVGESRNDYDIFKGLAERMGVGEHWQMEPEELCRFLLETHQDPRIRSIDWEALKRDGVVRIEIERPHVPFRDMKFETPSGRIELYLEQFADIDEASLTYREPIEGRQTEKAKRFPFNLITYKHVHSAHSTHLMLPMIREALPRPALEIHPADAESREIEDGDLVEVFNERGRFKVHAQVSGTVRPGTLAIAQGWSQTHYAEGHPSDLGHIPRNEFQERVIETNYPVWDILADVRLVEKTPAKTVVETV